MNSLSLNAALNRESIGTLTSFFFGRANRGSVCIIEKRGSVVITLVLSLWQKFCPGPEHKNPHIPPLILATSNMYGSPYNQNINPASSPPPLHHPGNNPGSLQSVCVCMLTLF